MKTEIKKEMRVVLTTDDICNQFSAAMVPAAEYRVYVRDIDTGNYVHYSGVGRVGPKQELVIEWDSVEVST